MHALPLYSLVNVPYPSIPLCTFTHFDNFILVAYKPRILEKMMKTILRPMALPALKSPPKHPFLSLHRNRIT
jgi:hypothetical protein